MRRTILTSFLIIGAALAVVFGGGTFSSFSDVENINGTATAGILDFEICGDYDDGVEGECDDNWTGLNEAANDELLNISFDDSGEPCGFTIFFPGDTCTLEVDLYRATPLAAQSAADLSFSNFTVQVNAVTAVASAPPTFNGTAPVSNNVTCLGVAGVDGWNVTVSAFVDTFDNALPVGADQANYFPAGQDDSARFTITVELDPDADNACQADSLTITLRVHADQAADAHDATDTDTD